MRSRLLLLVGGLLVGLLLAEGLCRAREALVCTDRDELFWEPNRFWGWGHEPGARGFSQRCLEGRPEWRTYSRINSLGLREREIPHARRGVFRILVLGDSFTEALQVDQADGFTRLLEGELAARAPVEVINAGVGAWGTDNALLFYRHEGWRYRPDLVLLAFFTGNDVIENHADLLATRGVWYPPKPHFVLAENGLLLRDYPLPSEPGLARAGRRFRHALRRRSALYRLVAWVALPRVRAAHAAPAPTGGNALLGIYLKEYPERWREAWRIARGLILRLRAEVERRGSRFAVVVINDRVEVADPYWRLVFTSHPGLEPDAFDRERADRLLTQFLARRGIPTVSLLTPFRARFGEAGPPGFFPWDGHWDRPGHALAAQVIATALRDQGLVGARP